MPTTEPTHQDVKPRQSMLVRAVIALPNWGLRVLLWFLSRIIYRIKVLGQEKIPRRGGALLVSNHMSFVDVVLISAAANRPIRFLIFSDVYNVPFIKPFALLMRAIPIPTEMRPRDMVQAFHQASDAIRAGELVCVFAEGHITRTGSMLPFRKGMERIIRGLDAPIIPVNLHGVWGSIFSYERERFLWKAPRRMPYRVTVSFASRLIKLIFVTRRMRSHWKGQEMVGVLMPPSAGGALVNFAAMLLGKVPVNLNYTASTETLESCAQQCGLQTVVTSKLFLEKLAAVNRI